MLRPSVIFLTFALFPGCTDPATAIDGGTDGAPDATPSGAWQVAPHPPLPEELNLGGPVLKLPRIVTITYDDDPMRSNIERFAATVGQSSFWTAVTAEYGVGPATAGRPVHVSDSAPAQIDDRAVKAWFLQMLDGTHPELDLPDGNTMYALYYPAGTTYTIGSATGCKEFAASDNLTWLPDGRVVPYIVLPRCPPFSRSGLGEWDTLAAVSSHEFYEEATDPEKTAVFTVDADHLSWAFMPPFSEIGDMCNADLRQYIKPPDLDATVQRAWSNAAARAGMNPCVPAPEGVPYFNAAPVLPDDVPITSGTFRGTTKGVRVPVGESRTIEVDLFSERPVPPWRVRAVDLATLQGQPARLALSLDRDHGQNGDKLMLRIHALAAADGGGARFVLYSDDGVHDTFWIGYVAN